MPALSYKARFVDLVVGGVKPHSIRAGRRFKKGDTLFHYTAMRTKQCRKIRPDTICEAAPTIVIDSRRRRVHLGDGSIYYRRVCAELLDDQIVKLAERDGFADIDAFFDFFRQKDFSTFSGQLIEWNPFAPAPVPAPENGEPTAARIRAPFSPVRSRPAAAGKRKPRGRRRKARAAAASPRAAK